MECDICNETKNKEVFNCDGCRNSICKTCGNLTSSEVKVLQLKESRALKFHCPKCRGSDTIVLLQKIIASKETIIDDKNEIISLLKNEIDKLNKMKNENENKFTCKASYADVIKSDIKVNIPSLVIKPKSVQTTEKTRKDIQTNINPADLKIGVKYVKTTKNGSIVIKCPSVNDVETLKKAAQEKLMHGYEIVTTKMQKPKIKIVGYNGKKNLEEVQESLRKQNDWIETSDDLKITYIKQRKNLTAIIYGECSSSLFHKFMSTKKVYIDWERYPVYEDLTITRCFKCQEFFHKNNNCTNKKVCELCTGEHDSINCPKQFKKCKNCSIANSKYNTKYQIDHFASDRDCPTLKYHTEVLKSKINYAL